MEVYMPVVQMRKSAYFSYSKSKTLIPSNICSPSPRYDTSTIFSYSPRDSTYGDRKSREIGFNTDLFDRKPPVFSSSSQRPQKTTDMNIIKRPLEAKCRVNHFQHDYMKTLSYSSVLKDIHNMKDKSNSDRSLKYTVETLRPDASKLKEKKLALLRSLSPRETPQIDLKLLATMRHDRIHSRSIPNTGKSKRPIRKESKASKVSSEVCSGTSASACKRYRKIN
jgi:hypothetical protein